MGLESDIQTGRKSNEGRKGLVTAIVMPQAGFEAS